MEEHGYIFEENDNIYMHLAPLNCQLQQLKYLAMYLYFDLPMFWGNFIPQLYKDHLTAALLDSQIKNTSNYFPY